MKKKVLLTILDGLGLRDETFGNAVAQAHKPNLDGYFKKYSSTTVRADGEYVGLPEGQMGNSEVGHLNIGAGRVVHQSLGRINKSISDGSFFTNEKYMMAIQNAKKNNSAVHILGLLSDGGVHSHIEHIKAMIEMLKKENVKNAYLHPFFDGRDVDPKSAKQYLKQIEDLIENSDIKIGTVSGRYYSMDRDKRWDRVELSYNAIIMGESEFEISDISKYIDDNYTNDIHDEFIKPAIVDGYSGAKDNDSFIFMNYRPDRAIQLSGVITNSKYNPLEDNPIFLPKFRPQNITYVTTMKYSHDVIGQVAYAPQVLKNTLGEVVSQRGIKQLRIAETEKYPHVTFFFDGGSEAELEGSKKILINSPKVATYDLKPEMSAYELTDALLKELDDPELELIILNFANPDMVGHSGMLEPTKKAIEAVDVCLGKIIDKLTSQGGSALITADHGNSDKVLNKDGSPNTAHTTAIVPLILVDDKLKLKEKTGALCDIAPSLLTLLGEKQPSEMTGESLIDER